jgi:hypothetical protein
MQLLASGWPLSGRRSMPLPGSLDEELYLAIPLFMDRECQSSV